MKCVYKIVCRDKEITEFYVGSSLNFGVRKRQHKSYSNNINNRSYCNPIYMFINVNGGFDNWDFEVVKEYKFITKDELTINEQAYIDLLKPHLNYQNAKGLDIERKKNTVNFHSNSKANCPHCNLLMKKNSIKRHIKRKH